MGGEFSARKELWRNNRELFSIRVGTNCRAAHRQLEEALAGSRACFQTALRCVIVRAWPDSTHTLIGGHLLLMTAQIEKAARVYLPHSGARHFGLLSGISQLASGIERRALG